MQDLEDLLRCIAVSLEIAGDKDALAAEPAGAGERHGRSDAKGAGLVRGGRHHPSLTGAPIAAHDHRLAAQLGPAQLLDRGVEGIQVDVHDHPGHVGILCAGFASARIVGRGLTSVYPFERFSESAKEVLTLAQAEAERGGLSYIGTEHLLLGLIAETDGLGGRVLRSFGLELAAILGIMKQVLSGNERIVQKGMIPTSRVKRIIEMAFEDARRLGQIIVGTDNMLVALLAEGQGIAAHVLLDRGVTVERVTAEINRLKDQGGTDRVRSAAAPGSPKHRHLEIADSQGRPVLVDVIFPTEYSDTECETVAARIRQAIPQT